MRSGGSGDGCGKRLYDVCCCCEETEVVDRELAWKACVCGGRRNVCVVRPLWSALSLVQMWTVFVVSWMMH